MKQETGSKNRTPDSRIQAAIEASVVNDSRGKSDTYKGYSSWAVPDGTLDASQTRSDNGGVTSNTTGRVTIPDPSDTLGDPVREETVRKLVETAERLVANRNASGSGVTSPYGTIDDTVRVQISQDVMTRERVSNITLSTRSSRVPD